MKTNNELCDELKALATALAHSTGREGDLEGTLAGLDDMKGDRARLMMMWVTMHFDHVTIHGDCSHIS